MGALHAGHVALVSEAVKHAAHVVVSIFVNPTQFSPTEDLSSYPRTLESDIRKVKAAGAHAVYTPRVEDMYGDGFCTSVKLAGPAVAGLEDRFRPTHFEGVATVVLKLLNQCRPDYATFGEKDYQQLQVVSQMVRDLDIETVILPVPTLREADGLAMSSRNVYLSAEERVTAPVLHATLVSVARNHHAGLPVHEATEIGIEALTRAGFAVDYLEARDSRTLAPLSNPSPLQGRLLAAAKLGRTRLIDNIPI